MGSRGAVICAMGALDMALWDIKGRSRGETHAGSCWATRYQASHHSLASLQPSGHKFEDYRDSLVAWALRAKELGFQAGKMEVTLSGPYNRHSGLIRAG